MLQGRAVKRAALAAFLAFALCLPMSGAEAGETLIGTACTGTNYVTDWDTIGQCSSGTYARGAYALGSVAAAAGSSCTGYPTGAIRFNSTLTAIEFCNTNWTALLSGNISLGTSVTAANPQISGDATSGLFTPAANTVSVAAGGTEAVRFLKTASAVNYLTITDTSPPGNDKP